MTLKADVLSLTCVGGDEDLRNEAARHAAMLRGALSCAHW